MHVLPVQGNIYMLVADGTNITASIGADGVLLVNTGSAQMSDKVLAAVNQLANSAVTPPDAQHVLRRELSGRVGMGEPVHERGDQLARAAQARPLHHQHQRGCRITSAATRRSPRPASSRAAADSAAAVENVGRSASIVAHENVLNRMSAPGGQGGTPRRRRRSRPTRTSTSSTSCPSTSTAKR